MKFIWPESARTDLRGVDRESAMRILTALTRFGDSGEGDVKALSGDWTGCHRLRVGDFRVIFEFVPDGIAIARVRHRSDVYR